MHGSTGEVAGKGSQSMVTMACRAFVGAMCDSKAVASDTRAASECDSKRTESRSCRIWLGERRRYGAIAVI